ncbi:MAG TPA: arginine--tRNA ligase [Actinocrinis sp.]
MTSLYAELDARLAAAFATAAGRLGADSSPAALRRSRRADFQADGALAAARSLSTAPRGFAEAVVASARLEDLCSRIEVAGPGFINLTVRDDVLGRYADAMAADPRLGVAPTAAAQTVVVDYSGPNAAKEMHVGHLRSTIIGDSVVRLLELRGHTVLRRNHLGEWGTPFGMLVEHLLDVGEDEAAHELSVGDLSSFYQAARVTFDADAAFRDRARRRVVLLQSGDEATLRLWEILVRESKRYFMAVYELLRVKLTAADFAGESSYNALLEPVAQELDRLGLLRESEGAQCVFPAGFTGREGEPLPLIVRKSDGGFGYDATDLAAIRQRLVELRADRLLYVIGLPQQMHLTMVFRTAREAGWARPGTSIEQVGFGSILGEDGRMLRSRAGVAVKLVDLLTEAVARARTEVEQRNPDLDPQTAASVARSVGIGAVKYADLSTDRAKDYVFDYDRMLALEGDTAPYLQYAHARIHSLFAKAGVEGTTGTTAGAAAGAAIDVREPAEHDLALALLGFPQLIEELEQSLEFHRLTGYLFALAAQFSVFYEKCPVLRAQPEIRASRLALCALTARVLAQGLDLLGIDAPTVM